MNGTAVSASGKTEGYPASYASSCNGGTDDGPDVVRV